jgi:thymidylate kinase
MLICLCGLDRTGKTSVAESLKAKGFEVMHLSAPDKKFFTEGYSGPSYLEEYVEMLLSFQGKNVVMDRFWDGEFVWSKIYGRAPLLTEEDLETLQEIERNMDVQYILMHDPNVEAHWKRCVDNKEPLTKAQIVLARKLYSELADKYGFQRKTLLDFPEVPIIPQDVRAKPVEAEKQVAPPPQKLTNEQVKLETANAINEVLGKRIVKQKGPIFDKIEINLRTFLNTELGKILGTKTENPPGQFSTEEVELLRFFCKKLKENQK